MYTLSYTEVLLLYSEPFVIQTLFVLFLHGWIIELLMYLSKLIPVFNDMKAIHSIVFTHGVWMGGRAFGQAAGKSLSVLYLRNRMV